MKDPSMFFDQSNRQWPMPGPVMNCSNLDLVAAPATSAAAA